MSALYNSLKKRYHTLKFPKSSEIHSQLGHSDLFSTENRLLNWLLCQNCFDLSSAANFKSHLQKNFANFQSELKDSMAKLAEKESEDWDDPLASNIVTSFEMEAKHQINVDLERTEYFVGTMSEEQAKAFCFKLLFRWSMKHRKLGYRQGMNELLSILMKIVFDFKWDFGAIRDATSDAMQSPDSGAFAQAETQVKPIFGGFPVQLNEEESEIKEILTDKLFLCGFLFDSLFANGIKDFYHFESKGVKKSELFLHQTVHKIFKKRLKVVSRLLTGGGG